MNKLISIISIGAAIIITATATAAVSPAAAAVPPTMSANPNFAPQLTSAKYWSNRIVYVAQVINIDYNKKILTYNITEVISGAVKASPGQLTARNWWRWAGPAGQDMSDVKNGDYLLVFEGNGQAEPQKVIRKIADPGQEAIVGSLKKIVAVNADGTRKSLLDNAISRDDLVADYCLTQLLALSGNVAAPADYPAKLQLVANDPKRDNNIRLMAYQLAARISNRTADSAAEFAWLKGAVLGDQSNDYQQVRPLIQRMLDLSDRRKETAAFLIEVVRAPNALAGYWKAAHAAMGDSHATPVKTPVIWSAAYDGLSAPRLFNGANPDDVSEMIFANALDMLKDQEPAIRVFGADLLVKITVNIAPNKRLAFAQRATQGIQNALDGEKDADIKDEMQAALGNLTSTLRMIEKLSQGQRQN